MGETGEQYGDWLRTRVMVQGDWVLGRSAGMHATRMITRAAAELSSAKATNDTGIAGYIV